MLGSMNYEIYRKKHYRKLQVQVGHPAVEK